MSEFFNENSNRIMDHKKPITAAQQDRQEAIDKMEIEAEE